ncbi:hypothetical protein NE237_028710 [Protea cynaroides]|uniref:PRONE domain-containing protein n=1 Tax=Protea cynaroides TaxID=273540 RepID=A0A9Q0GSJ4_9MAGN|nr:hypothetical protein NE237_028710 [Protea cynaroides]
MFPLSSSSSPQGVSLILVGVLLLCCSHQSSLHFQLLENNHHVEFGSFKSNAVYVPYLHICCILSPCTGSTCLTLIACSRGSAILLQCFCFASGNASLRSLFACGLYLVILSSMSNVSSEDGFDQQSERFGSYSLSADVSESESSSCLSCRRYNAEGASSSLASSPLAGRPPTINLEVELMKERFAKLLLGEDMSGGRREYVLLWQSPMPLLISLGLVNGSYYFWGAMEAGAIGAAEEGNVVQRDGMAFMRN